LNSIPRTIFCLGNPGPEYSATRHNVGWWLAERFADRFELGRFRQEGRAGIARGEIDGIPVQVVKPLTYMNRSGDLLRGAAERPDFDLVSDLLVVVDEVALPPGRSRFRPAGRAGGHNGLKSIQAALGTTEYSRLRIGVGAPPPDVSMVDWVLAPPPLEDRRTILDSIDGLVDCVAIWMRDGIDVAMNRCNG
jgi:PTH1 family peptidyl-tRNA hydrolase